jgi:hypothetical protein
MRIRSIKPEFWRSDDVDRLDWHTRLLFIGLWSYVDDNGVGRDRESDIAADLFSADLSRDPRDTLARVADGLQRLAEGGQISRYEVDGRQYLHVAAWDRHQKIDRPAKPRYPLPTSKDATPRDTLATPSRDLRDSLDAGAGEQGNRGTGEQGKTTTAPRERGRRIPDDFAITDEMRQWATDNGFGHLDLDHITDEFRDYWSAEAGSRAAKLDWIKTWHNRVREVSKRTPSNVRAIRGSGDRAGMVKWAEVRPGQWQECHPEGFYMGCKTEWRPAR